MQKVLIVDDEPSILILLRYNLEKAGYLVDEASDGRAASQMAREKQYDFIILDIMLPQLDGMEVCKALRRSHVDTPIIMLTAKDDEVDKIIGLELGADDYMTKPFSPRELLARMKVISRRGRLFEAADEASGAILEIGELRLDQDRHEVYCRHQLIHLTPKEYELLYYLMKRAGRILSRERLLEHIWGFAYTGETRIVDVHIGKLREKIEQDTKKPRYIQTVRGYGYKFEG